MNIEKVAVVIPSLEPNDKFVDYIKEIKECGDMKIIVVDDGNTDEYSYKFGLAQEYGCIVLRHGVNCGKGRSIKTALNHILVNMPDIEVIVTADGDGTYIPADIVRVAQNTEPNTITLGCRDFKSENISSSSKYKNFVTSSLFKMLADIPMNDTQTGLRAFQRDILPYLITVNGERYQYDFNVIAEKKRIQLKEIPVTTVKRVSDKKSHFRPIVDTGAVLWTFFLFIMVSLSATIIDLVLYSIFIEMLIDEFPLLYVSIATFLARIVSDAYNYYFDKKIVFKTDETSSPGRYVVLCILKTLASAAAVTALVVIFKDGETVSKLVVDMIIFFIAYKFEKNWVHEKK